MTLLLFTPQLIHAQEILITKSPTMNKLILDGKWTHKNEWKESAHKQFSFGEKESIHLRTAHSDNFIYFLFDYVTDTKIDTNMDRAVICLEPNDEKKMSSTQNDYCFMIIMNGKQTHVLQGGSNNAISGNFKKVNLDGFIGIGSTSDKADRYSKTPHASYEFKIPTDIVGRSSVYGFYFYVYDYSSDQIFSWPGGKSTNNFSIPPPNSWGTLISPDKTLPEFSFSIIFPILFSLLAGFFVLTKSKFINIRTY